MPPSGKNAAALKNSLKSNATAASITTGLNPIKPSLIVTMKTAPEKLRAIVDPDSVKEETPVRELKESPATSTTLPTALNSNTENASDSTPNTPPASTPAAQPSIMGSPANRPKEKGVKRGAGAAAIGNGEPKVRGKLGRPKKQRLEDGTIEGSRGGGPAAHKLGPKSTKSNKSSKSNKANQEAFNAGLRALDRSGKPCRKWVKGPFTIKSFTGYEWEISQWVALSKPEDSTPASAEGSSKENKEDSS
ncbi:INO80 complex, subunit Ies4 [Lasiosphaeria miniovina]|uniref:INO80 complex, subunit Ies4 n=1 Tax=Lasiosphaeria miniovina TaxID=1954250 RepID=A0AA39ZT61_9PEZI|nr:INO80 complex, subunit Ies4 [Lasiosphaeria miniovina]KAK0703180.1 INO80 complex, subunit Ies4 [Lasiosphaeria miniovina]